MNAFTRREVHMARHKEVRENVRLAGALLGRLRDELDDPGLAYRTAPLALRGGRFSSVFTFELVRPPEAWSGPLVLRLVGTSDQCRLEAGLHEAAQTAKLGSPHILLVEPSESVVGQPFLVMQRLPGRSYLRGVEPWRFALDLPKIATWWPRQLADVLAALGRVDTGDALRALDHHGVSGASAHPGRHLQAVSTALAGDAAFADVLEWLHATAPAPATIALVHGDLWPGNVFIGDGTIRLIDWTRGGLDDPALDVGFAKVGFALMPEPFPPPAPIRHAVQLVGTSISQRISAHCDHIVGGRDRVRYYEALRCTIELAGIVADRTAGRRAGWEHGVAALTRHLEGITNQRLNFA